MSGKKEEKRATCGECERFKIYDLRDVDKGFCQKPNGRLKENEFGELKVFGSKSTACNEYKPFS